MYINIYKSPGIETEKLKEGLEFIYKEIEGKDVDLVVAGDMNLPRLGMWTPIELAEARTRIVNNRGNEERDGTTQQEVLFMELMESYFLDQVVKTATREGATLDLVFTNAGNIRRVEAVTNGYTDHRTIIVNMVGYVKEREENKDRGSHYLSNIKI